MKMYSNTKEIVTFLPIIFVLFSIVGHYTCTEDTRRPISFRTEKLYHNPHELTSAQIAKLADLSNVTHLEEVLDNICVVRVVGTQQHKDVKKYIKKSMQDLNWTVEFDLFDDRTPTHGTLEFENIIVKLNPNAKRYLALACHYDSKYFSTGDFVGATDSAVPCAQLINLAKVMSTQLQSVKDQDVSLMFIFFDGEEAFDIWGPKDSIYGARHLAEKWHHVRRTYGSETDISDLDRMDLLVLLDLLGAPDPTFYNYFDSTEKWYTTLLSAENKLAGLRKFSSYSYDKPEQRYFQPYSIKANIEDDHIPFLRKSVPILHMIPYPFPPYWHELGDNRANVSVNTTENINKILRVFVASYLHIDV